MEKQAVVRAGKTPSVESGIKSSFVKNGNAFAKGETDKLSQCENSLAKHLAALYNTSSDGQNNR